MNCYHIKGSMWLARKCECSWCKGHEHTVLIDDMVDGENEFEAVDRAKALTRFGIYPNDWQDAIFTGTVVIAPRTPAEEMEMMGCPSLFDLD